jgi:hypothetical protein
MCQTEVQYNIADQSNFLKTKISKLSGRKHPTYNHKNGEKTKYE